MLNENKNAVQQRIDDCQTGEPNQLWDENEDEDEYENDDYGDEDEDEDDEDDEDENENENEKGGGDDDGRELNDEIAVERVSNLR